MLRDIHNFRNRQGDDFPQAVILVKEAYYAVEKVESYSVSLKRTDGDDYEREESANAENYEGLGGEIKFIAEYWTGAHKMQAGKAGYILEGASGEIEHTLTFNEQWQDKFDSIQGTETQKVKTIIEQWIKEVIIPELREG